MLKSKMTIMSIGLLIISVISIHKLAAQESNTKVEGPTLAQFSSLVGHWRGEGLGGVCEETWLPESAGIMLGTFKLMQEGQVNFFEIMTLSIDSIGPAVRVKHFNADMTAWEDKADMILFRYDSTSAGNFYFGGLTFDMSKPDSMKIGIRFKKADGSSNQKFINCSRVDLK